MTAPSRDELLRLVYWAFDARDIDTVLAAPSADVDWPNGWEGGRVVGLDAVRRYWERQWAVRHVDTSTGDLVQRMDVEQQRSCATRPL